MRSIMDYITEVQDTLNQLPVDQVANVIDILLDANASGKTIFTMGNGGSAATASHLAGDLSKGTITPGKPRFRVIALTDNLPQITAWSNDANYSEIFSEQLHNLMRPGDIIIAISGSGNSSNVLKAVEFANQNGGLTIGFCGFAGGRLSKMVDIPVVVPCHCMEQIEDIHLVLSHLISTVLRKRLSGVPAVREQVSCQVSV